jgi:hypothetical protein
MVWHALDKAVAAAATVFLFMLWGICYASWLKIPDPDWPLIGAGTTFGFLLPLVLLVGIWRGWPIAYYTWLTSSPVGLGAAFLSLMGGTATGMPHVKGGFFWLFAGVAAHCLVRAIQTRHSPFEGEEARFLGAEPPNPPPLAPDASEPAFVLPPLRVFLEEAPEQVRRANAG